MSDSQFRQYNNIILFAEKYRKYKRITPIYTKETFRKDMQPNKYVKMEYVSQLGRKVIIYLFASDSKYAISSQDLNRLLSKNRDPCDVILITEKPFKIHTNRVINSLKHLSIKCYLHKIFELELPIGPLSYPHRIMSKEEVNTLLNNALFCNLTNLPKILEEDPQCIWIGASVADVIEITMISDIMGKSIQYRVVIPKSGKMITFKKENNVQNDEKKEEDDDEDEEIKEYREVAKNELSDYEEDDTDDINNDNSVE